MAIEPPPPTSLPTLSLPWEGAFPWVIHRITTRGEDPAAPFDLGLGARDPAAAVMARWDAVRALPGIRTVVHARQVHGSTVRTHRDLPPGFLLSPPADGHLVAEAGVLLAVSVADCVPVFLLSEAPRAVGLLHAGWRGVVEGIVEAGIGAFQDRLGVAPSELHLWLGPSIGGDAYEVGPEVHRALGLPDPGRPALLDLRGHLLTRAERAGLLSHRMAASTLCTRTDPRFFSHRGGDAGRQMALLGIRLEAEEGDR